MRRLIAFACDGETLAGTLDEAPGTTGLLIVSGGNEIRIGAHRGQTLLARRLAVGGTPVFRYDRRGIGDSTGENCGYMGAGPDLAAAAAAFRSAAPHVTRLVGFGNCDAATTLALFGRAAGLDRIILANPWIVEPVDDLPPVAAIRARYATALRDPATWRRALSGGIDLRKLARGVRRLSHSAPRENALADRVLRALADWGADAAVILAKGDATAIAFAAAARSDVVTETIDTASHSFAGNAAATLEAAIGRHLI